MGILTTKESAKPFSSYVTVFGIALLIASSIYLRKLNNWAETNKCVSNIPPQTQVGNLTNLILCSEFETWRTASKIGIFVGVVNFLMAPILCCCLTCAACGCLACLCLCIESESSDSVTKPTTKTTTTDVSDVEAPHTEPSTETPVSPPAESSTENNEKSGLDSLSPKVSTALDVTAWIIWVFMPFICTAIITAWLYQAEAIRTANNDLYPTALSLYVIGLLNLMIYSQKVVDSVCKYLSDKMCSKSKGENEDEETGRLKKVESL